MLILGIDPGTATTGYGLLRITKKPFSVVKFGLIETDKSGDAGKRLVSIRRQMDTIIHRHNPDVVAIERLFFATNAKTAMAVGQACGVLMYSAARADLEIFEYAPGTIKKVVAGDGRADKKKLQRELRKQLGAGVRSKKNKKTHFDNEADALAVALCHALSIDVINRRNE